MTIVLFLLLFYGALMTWLVLGISRHRAIHVLTPSGEHLSVIIAVRNARRQLPSCLQALADQDYDGPIEVLIADDHSTDDTAAWVQAFIQKRPNWKLIQPSESGPWKSSKKAALEAAIDLAQGEWLLLTDADCVPPVTWIRTLASCFDKATVLVAGFSPQRWADRPGWNRFLLIDSLSAALVSAGTLGWGQGCTGSGRNLAYRRSAWKQIRGFAELPNSLSGDDDFIIQALSRIGRVRYCLSPLSVVPALGPPNWRQFLRQKQRHLSAGRHYPLRTQLLYGLYHTINVIFWLTFGCAFFFNGWLSVPLLAKMVCDAAALQSLAKPLRQKIAFPAFLQWQVLFVLYHLRAALRFFLPPKTW